MATERDESRRAEILERLRALRPSTVQVDGDTRMLELAVDGRERLGIDHFVDTADEADHRAQRLRRAQHPPMHRERAYERA
jgi:hypothetical protein